MIKNLSNKENFFSILALDHGLTVGYGDSVYIVDIPNLLECCNDTIGSVVMTYGLAKHIAKTTQIDLPLIVQCFGAPKGHIKVQVSTIESVLDLGAKGIAVQIDFELSGKDMSDQLQSISKLVSEAHLKKLPVLFMVAHAEVIGISHLTSAIRFCTELGADLIKIQCNLLSLNENHKDVLKNILLNSPPVLLSGGVPHGNIIDEVAISRKLNFSGYCIGRNIFKSNDPAGMSKELYNVWHNSRK